jgi:hypothetical protein
MTKEEAVTFLQGNLVIMPEERDGLVDFIERQSDSNQELVNLVTRLIRSPLTKQMDDEAKQALTHAEAIQKGTWMTLIERLRNIREATTDEAADVIEQQATELSAVKSENHLLHSQNDKLVKENVDLRQQLYRQGTLP